MYAPRMGVFCLSFSNEIPVAAPAHLHEALESRSLYSKLQDLRIRCRACHLLYLGLQFLRSANLSGEARVRSVSGNRLWPIYKVILTWRLIYPLLWGLLITGILCSFSTALGGPSCWRNGGLGVLTVPWALKSENIKPSPARWLPVARALHWSTVIKKLDGI